MIVVGGGSSRRFGSDKLLAEVNGRPLIGHTIDAIAERVDICVVVCGPEVAEALGQSHPDIVVVRGGATRTRSEIEGLAVLGDTPALIGIHDAARPLVSADSTDRLFALAEEHGGAVPVLEAGRVMIDKATRLPVTGLRRAQTPQVFRGPELLAAYDRAARAGFEGHDTVEVVQEYSELEIVAVPGDPSNIKVTFPADLETIRASLAGPSRTSPR